MSGTIPHHQNSGSIDPEALSLVADIGATNARFALAVSGSNELIKPLTLLTNNFTSILSACREYFNHIADLHPSRACIAVACPISGDHVSLTNNSWTFSIEEVRQKLNVGRLMVVNDFKAMAAGVPHLAAEEIDQIGDFTRTPVLKYREKVITLCPRSDQPMEFSHRHDGSDSCCRFICHHCQSSRLFQFSR